MLNEGYDGQKVFESTSGIFKDMGPYGLHGTAARL
jgi:hypothetical protein